MTEKLTPTPLQMKNAARLIEYEHGYLWGDPGTGKTLTSIVAIEQGKYDRCVVVGPVLSVGMWGEELLTQLGWEALVIRKGKLTKVQEKALSDGQYKAIVTTFSLATNKAIRLILQDFLEHGAQSALIVDEAHNCKNRMAQRTQALLSKPSAPRVRNLKRLGLPNEVVTPGNGMLGKGIGCYANDVWQLTGTPITRWPDDLYAQLAFGRQDTMKSYNILNYQDFVDKFCVTRDMQVSPVRRITTVVGAKNQDVLTQMLQDCKVIRCTLMEAAAELPPVTHRPVEVEIKSKVTVDMNIDDIKLAQELLNKDSPYAKAWHDLGMAKASASIDYIADVAYREPVLVGVWHRDVGQHLKQAFTELDLKVAYVHGGISGSQRDLVRDDFNAGKIDVLVGQMAAMNTSWNLQRSGAYVVVVEQLPSPATLTQFIHRIYRKGQEKHVQVDHIVTENKLDRAVERIRINKRIASDEVLDL